MNLNFKCPNCGANHATYHYTISTALHWTPVVKDGTLISNDPNFSSSYYTCCECGNNFIVREQYGEIIEVFSA